MSFSEAYHQVTDQIGIWAISDETIKHYGHIKFGYRHDFRKKYDEVKAGEPVYILAVNFVKEERITIRKVFYFTKA